jgi:hypothetical protein
LLVPSNVKIIDLVNFRPRTRFSEEFEKLDLDLKNPEQAFFAECYLKYYAHPSFCRDGVMDSNSPVISLPPGGAFPPRDSILRKTPKQFRKLFLSKQATARVSSTGNSNLNLNEGGGLLQTDRLPKEVHQLLCTFINSNMQKNPTIPLISQFLTYLQHGLMSLDEVLGKYKSPVYNASPFRKRIYKNGKREFLKNIAHPVYDKWDSLIRRTNSDPAYATTRITFPWKGSYMPQGRLTSQREKYAFFSFVYATDLLLGALPLWPLPMCSEFQLDRKDPMRHYTIDNIRWLNKSDNVANKPSTGKGNGTLFRSTKDVIRLLNSCERTNILTMEMLGALSKGYGTS